MNKLFNPILILFAGLLAACSTPGGDEAPPALEPTIPGPTALTETPTKAEPQVEPSPTSGSEPATGPEGTLYYLAYRADQPVLFRLDLASDEETIVFEPPPNAWLAEAAASPDGSQLVLAYSPAPEERGVQYGFTDLYLLASDGTGEPTPLLERADPSESIFNISWPTDDTLYFAHFGPVVDEAGVITYVSRIERLHLPDGKVEVVAEAAAWPRASADGSQLAYVTEQNEFILAAADGSNPRVLLDGTDFAAVDAPLFSPDGQQICFSAVDLVPVARRTLWDRLLGVGIAQAHAVPSDWWCMAVDGRAAPVRLTELGAIGLYGDFSADGEQIVFVATDGVYLMEADGSALRQLRQATTTGPVSWRP